MLQRIFPALAAGLLCLMALSGCGGDRAEDLVRNPETRAHLIDVLVADSTAAPQVAARLIGSTETRGMLMEQALSDRTFSQELMTRVSTDPAFVTGVIGLGMQDSSMKQQLTTLFRGVEMAR